MAGATDGHHHHEDPRKMEETQKATSSLCHFPSCVCLLWRCDGAIKGRREAATAAQTDTSHNVERSCLLPFRLRNQSKNVLLSCFRIERKGRSETKQKKE